MSVSAPEAAPWWRPPPAAPALGGGGVHVWEADLDRPARPLAQLARTLSLEERSRAGTFAFPRDRRRFIAARGMLRFVLAGYLDCEPGAVALRAGVNHKPELASGDQLLRFNHSRSQDRALYAVSRGRRVGVDLEALRPIPEAEQIAQRWFSPREQAALAAVPSEQRAGAFLRGWTGKEAYVKAVGAGLAGGLERVEVELAEPGPLRLRAIDGDPAGAAGWSLRALPGIPGFVAALVVEAPGGSLDGRTAEARGIDLSRAH